jgi:hypothetical protein
MPRPSARVGVLGRWEERINPAPGGVLVIREGNILGTGTIDDIPAAGALVPDDEECNICYWFGICEAPEPYGCLAGQFDFCPFELLFIYCPGVLPDRPIKIIEVNQSAVYCPGVLPDRPIKIIEVNQSAVYCPGILTDRPILVYCPLSDSQLTILRPVDTVDGTFTYCAFSTTELSTFRPVDTVDGTFTYCAFSTTELSTFRPVDTVDGTFTYCTFDLTNSGFDRTP